MATLQKLLRNMHEVIENRRDIRAARRAPKAWARYDRDPGAFMSLDELRAKLEAEGILEKRTREAP